MTPPRPLIIELAGPAGAGKSTLARLLAARNPALARSDGVWGQPRRALLAGAWRSVATWARLWWQARSPLWRETAQLVRLEALRHHFTANGITRQSATATVVDEGPVFALAWLLATGHPVFRTRSVDAWWRNAVSRWAGMVDVVVLLDAPDDELAERINGRAKPHVLRGADAAIVTAFAARFRAAFNRVLVELPWQRAPLVLRYDTTVDPPDTIAAHLDPIIDQRVHAN